MGNLFRGRCYRRVSFRSRERNDWFAAQTTTINRIDPNTCGVQHSLDRPHRLAGNTQNVAADDFLDVRLRESTLD